MTSPDPTLEKEDFTGRKVKVLGGTYEPGTPPTAGAGDGEGWRFRFASRDEMLRYLKTAERYWYSTDWYGSEKRKT